MPSPDTVTIAGGGLAGLALGVALRQHDIPVILHEAGSYPRHRVCGEFINGITRETLTELGIEECFADAVENRTTAWFAGSDVPFLHRDLPVPARGLSRHRMDDALSTRFRALGGTLHETSRLKPDATDHPGLVWATGRQQDPSSDWLGLKCHVADFDLQADLEMHLGDDGYLGISQIEDGKANVCGLFRIRPDVSAPREQLLPSYLRACGLEIVADRVDAATLVEGSPVGVSAFRLGAQQFAGADFRIGDRFAIIGPFTGNGMSMALEGAAISAPVLESWSKGEINWPTAIERGNSALGDAFADRLRLSGALHPFLTKGWRQSLLIAAAKSGVLPFNLLFRRLR